MMTDKTEEAIEVFNDFTENRPEEGEVDFTQEFQLSQLAYALGFEDDALATLLAMLEFPEGKENGDIEFEVAKYYWSADEKEKAIQHLRNVANRRPLQLLHWFAYACALDDAGKNEAIGVLVDIQEYLLNPSHAIPDELYLYRVSTRLVQRLSSKEELTEEESKKLQDAKDTLAKLSDKKFHDHPWNTVIV